MPTPFVVPLHGMLHPVARFLAFPCYRPGTVHARRPDLAVVRPR
ncbi:hypothetical protein STXM2123_4901 [Streptomyces sp. F-3]|nr:hypothetical protein STXM2123_4901 [Streptomyces sp. F-3]